MKITTKKGDTRRMRLLDKRRRVAKTDVRKQVDGTLDEVNSALGLACVTKNIPSRAFPLNLS